MSRVNLVWFRNDLRVHDQPALHEAAEDGRYVIPVYCLDPRQFGKTTAGFHRLSPHRVRFLIEGLADLRKSLQALGADLIIRRGKPEDILPEMALEWNAGAVFYNTEYADEEAKVERELLFNLGLESIEPFAYHSAALYHPEDLPMGIRQVPDVFTQFRKKAEKYSQVRDVLPAPKTLELPQDIPAGELPSYAEFGVEAPEISDKAVLPFKGGESAALDRLNAYCGFGGLLKEYKLTRNGLLGADYSSKFSPWLAQGSLSPRSIYWKVQEYEDEVVRNQSTYWLIFELIWRDFFRYWGAKQGNRIFWFKGINEEAYQVSRHEAERFQRWMAGETGIPFIDANMRELNQTGFMSNRGRQNVASFLVHDLKVNWLKGAAYFESMLLDYDVYSNYGNWAYVAGVGADPRPNRYFNVLRQADRYDEKGEYVKHWLSELSGVPCKRVHTVFNFTPDERLTYKARKYPEAILVPEAWNKILYP